MEFYYSHRFIRELKRLRKRQVKLYLKVKKQLKLFSKNPRHPSLRPHKLKGNLEEVWSISVDDNYRMLYTQEENEITFFNLGNHDEVYEDQ